MKCCADMNCREQGRICVPEAGLPRIVIVGGGFAGLNLLKKLKNKPVQVVLIDRNNFHQFSPLFYQVATSGIEPDSIVFPFRKTFERYRNVIFRMAEAKSIDATEKTLNTSIGSIHYDYLVLALGSDNNYFGNTGFEESGTGLKSITEALDIRSRLLQNLEQAATSCIIEEKEALGNVAVIGGGPAGVEMAGALAEFKRYILPKDYPELKNIDPKIYLIEATGRLLQWMPEKLSEKTYRYLRNMQVNVILNRTVKSYDGRNLVLNNGKILNAANFIWTAGVRGNRIQGLPGGVTDKQERIRVDAFGNIPLLPNVFAIGDLAVMQTREYPAGHPMVAQSAIQQGRNLAENLIRKINGNPMIPFIYKDKGSLATIGRKKAVALLGHRQFGGFPAWFVWSFVHLMGIAGVRNKLLVAMNWVWNYLTYDRGDRVIIRKYGAPARPRQEKTLSIEHKQN